MQYPRLERALRWQHHCSSWHSAAVLLSYLLLLLKRLLHRLLHRLLLLLLLLHGLLLLLLLLSGNTKRISVLLKADALLLLRQRLPC